MKQSRFQALRVGELDLLPVCRECDAVPPGTSWAQAAVDRWGLCGMAAVAGRRVVGYVLIAPALNAPRRAAVARAPHQADSALLLAAHVQPAQRRNGLGRALVQGVAARLVRSGTPCIEAVGSVLGGTCATPPLLWLEGVGFVVSVEHPIRPQLRLDLDRAVPWRLDLRAAWDRIAGAVVPPIAPPAPAGRASRRSLRA